MSIEFPVLHLGIAGFTAAQTDELAAGLKRISPGIWKIGDFARADAWCLNGARLQLLPDEIVRVAAGEPGQRSLHLALHDVDRPLAFAEPLAVRGFEPLCKVRMGDLPSMAVMLEQFEAWLRPVVAQFCLASSILEQESVLGSGLHHVTANDVLIAVVDLRGETGVLPTAGPADFEDAMWQRLPSLPSATTAVPTNFVRCSLAYLMWQHAVRTARDILPRRYRNSRMFFRRPPHLPHRLLTDSHLVLLRELAAEPGDFTELRLRTGMHEVALARDLAALYFVGAITTNPSRISALLARSAGAPDSGPSQQHSVPSGMGAEAPNIPHRRIPHAADATAPAPFGLVS